MPADRLVLPCSSGPPAPPPPRPWPPVSLEARAGGQEPRHRWFRCVFACVHAAPPRVSHMQTTGGRPSPIFLPRVLTPGWGCRGQAGLQRSGWGCRGQARAAEEVAQPGRGQRAPAAHHFADGLGLLGELVGVHLLRLQNPAVHLLPLHLLLAASERRLALDHLIEEAAQSPVVGAQAVPLVVQDFGSWARREQAR